MSWWSENSDTITAVAGAVSALGVVLWLLFTISANRQMERTLARQEQALNTMQHEDKNMAALLSVANKLQLAQCANPWVRQDKRMSAALDCPPVADQPLPPVPSAQVHQPPQGQFPNPHVQFQTAQVFEPHMPNYGYFGPFGTAVPTQAVGMPAFQQ